MKVIGVLTEDFAAYYDLLRALRSRDVPFVSLSLGETIPPNVGVVVTTASEAHLVRGPEVVVFTTPSETVEAAQRTLAGKRFFNAVIVGVDPGERPGVAVIGDGHVLRSVQVPTPEDVVGEVQRARDGLLAESFVVRVGNGAPTFRDRILLALQDALHVRTEVVDETASTPAHYRTAEERDTVAAKAIALARGVVAEHVRAVRPSDGEIRDIQRKSRLASEGRVTVSRALARAVAKGEMTLDEAVEAAGRRRAREA